MANHWVSSGVMVLVKVLFYRFLQEFCALIGKMINHGVQAALLSLQIGFVPYLTGRQNALLSGMLIGLHRKNVIERMEDIQIFLNWESF